MDKHLLCMVFIFGIVGISLADSASSYCVGNSTLQYADKLAQIYGTNGKIDEAGLLRMIREFQSSDSVNSLLSSCPENDTDCTKWKKKCPELVQHILQGKGSDSTISSKNLISVLPGLIHTLTGDLCTTQRNATKGLRLKQKPTTAETWGYGFGFVAFICFISNIGAVLGPLMNRPFFKRILSLFVSIAIGTLTSTGVMVLIPEAFDIMKCPEQAHDYLWKAGTAVVSIYVFYLSERFIKIAFYRGDQKKLRKNKSMTIEVKAPLNENDGAASHGHSHFDPIRVDEHGNTIILTVGWMVLVGDALHNFVDGLSIGAAFTQNIYTGISVSIAIVCEELPHELGDIAILLHAGFSMKRALLYNFLAALTCCVGLVLGIILGETTSASRWIFGIAGGLFLYVPLVDMLPEMSSTLDEEMHKKDGKVLTFLFVQMVGLLIGTIIILLVAHFASSISLG
ncbi:metal cation symporter ZIP8-like [Gigantopelta aegis]|uniref:metal cation symporter ZIP8-like n=1 Tax=Gigantopelta aegis TaxID=1735272 RepID=UPI001B88A0C8|nr:metal cation symporter ZIP8-like [Gigantopelta aegis]